MKALRDLAPNRILSIFTLITVFLLIIVAAFTVVLVLTKSIHIAAAVSIVSILTVLWTAAVLLFVRDTLSRQQDSWLIGRWMKRLNADESAILDTLNGSVHGDREELFRLLKEYSEKAYRMELLKKQAENDALQSQINPHFLYNTLDTIRGQALEDGSEDVAEMIECLSHLFRYSIDQKLSELMFSDELKNVEDYLKIQKYRFEDRFRVEYDVNQDDIRLMSIRVPKLILQPLVENAIRHGLEGLVCGGLIIIRAYATSSHFYVSVEDNGKGMSPDQVKEMNRKLNAGDEVGSSRNGEGIALYNVNKRIRFYFGSEYGLTIVSTEGYGTSVEINMPALNMRVDI